MKSTRPLSLVPILFMALAATAWAETPQSTVKAAAPSAADGRVTAIRELSLGLDILSAQSILAQIKMTQAPQGATQGGPRGPSRGTTLLTRSPEDHTPLFRVRHERAATSPDAKCNYCHTEISGSKQDNCQDCHAVMRPRSHSANFRTSLHGRLAAADSRKCATCHEIDYCTSCHEIAPTNHFPLSKFLLDHARVSRTNPRSCQTCHTFSSTCGECHERSLLAPAPSASSALRASRAGRR
jgi:hypothetical protein